ncbi:hypothetical protein DCPSUM001_20590 [Dysgonomonas capnocytophagoides]|nr:hypothetical protein DCPSUM001_20590 [Dysgonomonas capnocytophagoides]
MSNSVSNSKFINRSYPRISGIPRSKKYKFSLWAKRSKSRIEYDNIRLEYFFASFQGKALYLFVTT